jgi:hypothetical protein
MLFINAKSEINQLDSYTQFFSSSSLFALRKKNRKRSDMEISSWTECNNNFLMSALTLHNTSQTIIAVLSVDSLATCATFGFIPTHTQDTVSENAIGSRSLKRFEIPLCA